MKTWLFLCLLPIILCFSGCEKQPSETALPSVSLPIISGDSSKESMSLSRVDASVYLVNIWATWCSQCKLEHQYLLELSDEFAIVGVANSDFPQKVTRYLAEAGNPYFMVLDDIDGELSDALGAFGTPETFLIKEQKVLVHFRGVLTPEKWKEQFEPYL